MNIPKKTTLSQLAKAEKHVNNNNLNKAKSLLLKYLKNDPLNSSTLAILARVYLIQKQYKTALTYATKAMQIDSSDLTIAKLYALALSYNNRMKDAEKVYFQINDLLPKDQDAIRGLEYIYTETKEYQKLFLVYLTLLSNNQLLESEVENLHYCFSNLQINEYTESLEQNAIQLLESPLVDPEKTYPFVSQILILKYELDQKKEHIKLETLKKDSLFLLFIKKCLVKTPVLNNLIVYIRKELLEQFITKTNNNISLDKDELLLTNSIAINSWNNEYVEYISKNEKKIVKNILEEIDKTNSNQKSLVEKLLIVLCYRNVIQNPIFRSVSQHDLQNPNLLNWINKINAQLKEEESLSDTIPQLTPIEDLVSSKVKQQYEQNPYPRWQHCYSNSYLNVLDLIYKETDVYLNKNFKLNKNQKALIAGCGTGREVVIFSKAFNCPITAIDMSKSSLAYAKRKAKEHNIDNVSFGMADLLNLHEIGQKFDIISCNGVLHHLDNPMEGWHSLYQHLNHGGYMRISLYSRLARAEINQARTIISNQKITASQENIRKFRHQLISGEHEFFRPKQNYNIINNEFFDLSNRGDLSSMSNCRDLLFHVQEKQYTISEIETSLEQLNLKFIGFSIEKRLLVNPEQYFGNAGDWSNLSCWNEYEKKYPTTFSGMYQFWCYKE